MRTSLAAGGINAAFGNVDERFLASTFRRYLFGGLRNEDPQAVEIMSKELSKSLKKLISGVLI